MGTLIINVINDRDRHVIMEWLLAVVLITGLEIGDLQRGPAPRARYIQERSRNCARIDASAGRYSDLLADAAVDALA
jgi:hypothetical protein